MVHLITDSEGKEPDLGRLPVCDMTDDGDIPVVVDAVAAMEEQAEQFQSRYTYSSC